MKTESDKQQDEVRKGELINITFTAITKNVNSHVQKAEQDANDNGAKVQEDIGELASYLTEYGKIKLPESITLASEGVESKTGFYENQIKWLSKTNQLIKVQECFWESISAGRRSEGMIVPPSEEEQILGDMEGKDWLRFGPIIISKLQETVHESQQKSPQKPK